MLDLHLYCGILFLCTSKIFYINAQDEVKFGSGRIVGHVTSPKITEASGLAASRRHKDVLYTFNDSGGLPRIYAISSINGSLVATLPINGVSAYDWEDIAVGPAPGQGSNSYIYIGDTGGNVIQKDIIYRIKEPAILENGCLDVDASVSFSWNEADCETLLVDQNGHVYLISKDEPDQTAMLYQIPDQAWDVDSGIILLKQGWQTNIPRISRGPVAGDISTDGTEVLIKTYNRVYYWKIKPTEGLNDTLLRPPISLKYDPEPQGESIAWNPQSTAYYTLSEGVNQPLLCYDRVY